jgi:hypothetical protein
VNGNRAVIGIENDPGSLTPGGGTLFEVVDGSPDSFNFGIVAQPPTVCPAELGLEPFDLVTGDIVIHDAPPLPTSKDQCKDGGWRDYGTTFKNQGQCVSYVATRGRHQPAAS